MNASRVLLVALCAVALQTSLASVEMISDYARVAKNVAKPTTESSFSTPVTRSVVTQDNATENVEDYEDFDDIEEDRSLQKPENPILPYFKGIISLLALMHKFNGQSYATQAKNSDSRTSGRERKADDLNGLQGTGKQLQDVQKRFDFPKKKFKKTMEGNMLDQQYQPVENYPPYNPLTANRAESYGNEDQKSSYDVYADQIPGTDSNQKANTYQMDTNYGSSYDVNGAAWNAQNIPPTYQSWIPDSHDSGQHADSYLPWNPESDPMPGGYESYAPWGGSPVYNHGDKDPSPDHHIHYEEVEHPVDEDRVSKKPYSYYFLGRKLWYVPLLFSVYFIIYIGALVLKSIARHKIQFPEKIWNLHDEHLGHITHRRHRKINEITENYENALDKIKNKFM